MKIAIFGVKGKNDGALRTLRSLLYYCKIQVVPNIECPLYNSEKKIYNADSSIEGHVMELRQDINRLKKCVSVWKHDGCGPPPPGAAQWLVDYKTNVAELWNQLQSHYGSKVVKTLQKFAQQLSEINTDEFAEMVGITVVGTVLIAVLVVV